MRTQAVRLVPFALLAGLGGARWARMLDGAPTGRAWAWLGLGLATGAALLGVGRLPARRRLAAVAVGVAAVGLALLAAGLPSTFLAPRHWDELAAGVRQGLEALPGMTIPYTGSPDGWPALVVLMGGSLLVAAAAVSAFWPREHGGRPWAAATLLGVLSAVPGVVLTTPHAIVEGALLFVGLLALLCADRVRVPDAPVATALVAVTVVLAALLFPSFDRARPWFDYEAAAQDLVRTPVTFSWDHTYDALHWPRSGRELLRVRSPRASYWKAENLDDFDGLVWRAPRSAAASLGAQEADLRRRAVEHPDWLTSATVTIRGLDTSDLIGTGETIAVRRVPRPVERGATPGTWTTTSELRDGDAYAIRSYAPKPTTDVLAAAGTDYPAELADERAVALPPREITAGGLAGRDARLRVERGDLPTYYAPGWGSRSPAFAADPRGAGPPAGVVLASSAYAGVARLGRRLAARAGSPYEYARAIERYLGSSAFAYTETPPTTTVPLAAFLLRTKEGYCQQFSGAMALLLRLGGVPARVATGFSPGTQDRKTGEWVVRDVDAHSWVEAYFGGIGWVTFDPTPAASPARGQVTPNRVAAAPGGRPRFGNLNKDLRNPRPKAGSASAVAARSRARHPGQGIGAGWIVTGALGLAVLGGGAALALRDRRRRRSRRETDRMLDDLERALRRTGRPLEPATTLREVERRFARISPEAAGYVRAVRDLRYDAAAEPPTPAQRRALRHELARGLGPVGRARSWWAVPPARRRP